MEARSCELIAAPKGLSLAAVVKDGYAFEPSIIFSKPFGRLTLCKWIARATRAFSLKEVGQPLGLVFSEDALVLTQRGRAVELAPGEWTLIRTDVQTKVDRFATLSVVGLPSDVFYERSLSPLAALLRRFGSDESINRMVASVFGAIFHEAANLSVSEAGELSEAALRIMKAAVLVGGRPKTGREVLLIRVRELVEWRIRDPELSPKQIAETLNCTTRNIHLAFEGGAETLSQYILKRRLEQCRATLQAPEMAGRSVTEIAFSWGFNNAAHFSRVFKKRFGVSPSASRGAASIRADGPAPIFDQASLRAPASVSRIGLLATGPAPTAASELGLLQALTGS